MMFADQWDWVQNVEHAAACWQNDEEKTLSIQLQGPRG